MKETKEILARAFNSALWLFLATGAWYISGLAGITGIPLGVTALFNYLKNVSWIKSAVEMAGLGAILGGGGRLLKEKSK